MLLGLVAAVVRFLNSSTLSKPYQDHIKSISISLLLGLVAAVARAQKSPGEPRRVKSVDSVDFDNINTSFLDKIS